MLFVSNHSTVHLATPARDRGYEVGCGNTESVLLMSHELVGFVWAVLMLRMTGFRRSKLENETLLTRQRVMFTGRY